MEPNSNSKSTSDSLLDLVVSYVNADNEYEALKVQFDAAKKKKDAAKHAVSLKMESESLETIKISDGYIKLDTEPVKTPLTWKFISDVLTEFFGENRKRRDECEHFLRTRSVSKETQTQIKRFVT